MNPVALPSRNLSRVDRELCNCASSGDVARTRRLLDSGVSADSAYSDGTTALMTAAFAGEAEVVRLLLERGADPNLQDESGLTALMNAVLGEVEMDLDGGHSVFLEIARILVVGGSDLDLQDENGLTAAAYAASYQLEEMVELLGEA